MRANFPRRNLRYNGELFKLCVEFEASFHSKLCRHIAQLNVDLIQIKKIKEFIKSIELLPNGEPNLEGIGAKLELIVKYIKLAAFLLRFNGFSALGAQRLEGAGLSADFRNHIRKITEIRKRRLKKSRNG